MQSPISELIKLGKFPPVGAEELSKVKLIQDLLQEVQKPITNLEAVLLVSLFGEDTLFGLSWTLIHIIESAPGWPIEKCLSELKNPWIALLRKRAGLDDSSF